MLVRSHVLPYTGLIKWFVLAVLALGLALALTSTVSGADKSPAKLAEPRGLPRALQSQAEPLSLWPGSRPPLEGDVSESIWQAIALRVNGDYGESLEVWRSTPVPPESSVWKQLAMAELSLVMGDLDAAGERLQLAADLAPRNPLVSYYRGLTLWTRTEEGFGGLDPLPPQTMRLVAGVLPVSLAQVDLMRLAAIQQFESAIVNAADLWPDAPLVPEWWPTVSAVHPTVRDWMLATQSLQFVGKSHRALGSLYIGHGEYELAEMNLDRATTEGIRSGAGYMDLGTAWEAEGRHLDACRAYLKATRLEAARMVPLKRAWQSFRRSIL